MDFAYTPEDEAFKEELVSWLDTNLPKFLADWTVDDDPGGGRIAATDRVQERRRDWQRRLNEAGVFGRPEKRKTAFLRNDSHAYRLSDTFLCYGNC